MKRYRAAMLITGVGIIFMFHSFLLQSLLGIFFSGKILLVPVGKVSNRDLILVKNQVENFYGFQVEIGNYTKIPISAYYKPRNRYVADLLLEDLEEKVPGRYDKVIGIINEDIQTNTSTTKNWGILGLAKVWQKPCVVSTFRLKNKGTRNQYKERLSKVSIHEMGHTIGLPHCTNSKICVMRAAEGKLRNIDNTKLYLCSKCKSKIKYTQT